ncbi:hypothetical protein [Pararobbsia silviterrae]|nr:hypothetical protein [Pararobbsia silviterrae]
MDSDRHGDDTGVLAAQAERAGLIVDRIERPATGSHRTLSIAAHGGFAAARAWIADVNRSGVPFALERLEIVRVRRAAGERHVSSVPDATIHALRPERVLDEADPHARARRAARDDAAVTISAEFGVVDPDVARARTAASHVAMDSAVADDRRAAFWIDDPFDRSRFADVRVAGRIRGATRSVSLVLSGEDARIPVADAMDTALASTSDWASSPSSALNPASGQAPAPTSPLASVTNWDSASASEWLQGPVSMPAAPAPSSPSPAPSPPCGSDDDARCALNPADVASRGDAQGA